MPVVVHSLICMRFSFSFRLRTFDFEMSSNFVSFVILSSDQTGDIVSVCKQRFFNCSSGSINSFFPTTLKGSTRHNTRWDKQVKFDNLSNQSYLSSIFCGRCFLCSSQRLLVSDISCDFMLSYNKTDHVPGNMSHCLSSQ